jgi:hypothetical protein
MNRPTNRAGRLSPVDKGILALHVLAACVLGAVGRAGAHDPDWGDLQRFVIVMFVGAWIAGALVVGLVARRIEKLWIRSVLLLGAPPVAILLLVGAARFG